jgi:type III secretory pathway component EscS
VEALVVVFLLLSGMVFAAVVAVVVEMRQALLRIRQAYFDR